MLARSQLQLRNLTAAEKNLLWLRTHGGGDASEVDLVKLYLLGGRTSEGVSLATALTERLPQNDAPLANQLAELLLQQNQTQPALKLLSRITSTQPQTPLPVSVLSRTFVANGRSATGAPGAWASGARTERPRRSRSRLPDWPRWSPQPEDR